MRHRRFKTHLRYRETTRWLASNLADPAELAGIGWCDPDQSGELCVASKVFERSDGGVEALHRSPPAFFPDCTNN